jgi:hypothetical protein
MALTIEQAHNQWSAEYMPAVIAQFGKGDEPALAESWNDYTDNLCKEGQFSDLLYHYCPSWDDEIPDGDQAFVLERMGVVMSALKIPARPDGNGEWDSKASHWRLLIRRDGKDITTHYSMGSAHKGEPELAGVLHCLLMDADGVDGETFEGWADNLGMDSDSRKAEAMFKACQQTALELGTLFTKAELVDLRELFEDF